MEELFVPYEESLAIKELGFDEQCLGYYSPSGSKLRLGEKGMYVTREEHRNVMEYILKNSRFEYGQNVPVYKLVMAPLYQQAFKWFREKYNICGWVSKLGDNNYRWHIDEDFGYYQTKTYEEAELECLRKLIEIIKK